MSEPLGAGVAEPVDRHGAFPRLDDEQRARLRAAGDLIDVSPGQILFREGDDGYDFFVVESGAVTIVKGQLREDRPEDKPLLDVYANLFVERDSQKGIVIGHRGSRLKTVGATARKQIEAMLGTPVYLDLHVKIAKDWQRDPKQLRRLGF